MTIITLCLVVSAVLTSPAEQTTTAWKCGEKPYVQQPAVIVRWGNFFRERKLSQLPVASITVAKPIAKPSAKPRAKQKLRCRKGERQWYWNKKKGRKMYRTRKLC